MKHLQVQLTKEGQPTHKKNPELERLFVDIYEENHGRIYGYIARRTRDVDIALELTQEVFYRAYHNFERLVATGTANWTAWLFRAARNACIDRKRRQNVEEGWLANRERFLSTSVLGDEVYHIYERNETARAINAALKSLPDDIRDIFVACELHGKAREEVRSRVGLSRRTFFRRLAQARESMRIGLLDFWEIAHKQAG